MLNRLWTSHRLLRPLVHRRIIASGLLCAGLVLAEGHVVAQTAAFPSAPGTRWVYEGTVACATTPGDRVEPAGTRRTNATGSVWTALLSTGAVYRASVHWVMEVVEAGTANGLKAVVVRGHPGELAWAEFGREPGWCVLGLTSNKVVRIEADGLRDARRWLRRALASPRTAMGEPEVKLPLALDSRWGGDSERADGWYCWNVEAVRKVDFGTLAGEGFRSGAVFTLAYRTCPDHTVMEFAPGLGLVRYEFEHHGTVASVDVRLVEFHRPEQRSARIRK
jgi:hypothetical protein